MCKIYNIDIRSNVSLYMRIYKQMIKKRGKREKMPNNQKESKNV